MLLTLLDEGETALRVRALGALRIFWARCTADLMQRTGLAQVFEDAVFPAVLFLPSLTPEAESVTVLGAAYPVLMAMAGIDADVSEAAYGDEQGEPRGAPAFTEAQRKLLDRIIREGILVGYHHASEHMRLVELFCETLRRLVDGMGILSIKHLKVRLSLPPQWWRCKYQPNQLEGHAYAKFISHIPYPISHDPYSRPSSQSLICSIPSKAENITPQEKPDKIAM